MYAPIFRDPSSKNITPFQSITYLFQKYNKGWGFI
nr:MAG TPA: hypothetical protein [Caudoviricetes sp.]